MVIQPSASQTIGYQAQRKLIVEDSAERLLLKSPTELGFVGEALQHPLSVQNHHNSNDQRINQAAATSNGIN